VQGPLAAGRGVVVATAHFGNPEVAVQVGAIMGLNVLVLAEPLAPELARLMTEIRSQYGARYEDVGYKAVSNALRHLRAGGALAITADRDIQGRGARLPFFGEETGIPLGAVDFAARTNSVLCRRTSYGFEITFEPPVCLVSTGNPDADVRTNALALLQRVEGWIRAEPGEWMVLERIWKDAPGS
jgi:lauroyl/myristoyl acyltransferase